MIVIPRRTAQRAVFVERFVHDVPALDAALVAADHREDVVAHPREQRIPRQRLARRVLEHPARHLAVPHQRVADDEHPVALRRTSTYRSAGEKSYMPGRGCTFSHFSTFSGVIVLNWRCDERRADGVASGELTLVHRRADRETSPRTRP